IFLLCVERKSRFTGSICNPFPDYGIFILIIYLKHTAYVFLFNNSNFNTRISFLCYWIKKMKIDNRIRFKLLFAGGCYNKQDTNEQVFYVQMCFHDWLILKYTFPFSPQS